MNSHGHSDNKDKEVSKKKKENKTDKDKDRDRSRTDRSPSHWQQRSAAATSSEDGRDEAPLTRRRLSGSEATAEKIEKSSTIVLQVNDGEVKHAVQDPRSRRARSKPRLPSPMPVPKPIIKAEREPTPSVSAVEDNDRREATPSVNADGDDDRSYSVHYSYTYEDQTDMEDDEPNVASEKPKPSVAPVSNDKESHQARSVHSAENDQIRSGAPDQAEDRTRPSVRDNQRRIEEPRESRPSVEMRSSRHRSTDHHHPGSSRDKRQHEDRRKHRESRHHASDIQSNHRTNEDERRREDRSSRRESRNEGRSSIWKRRQEGHHAPSRKLSRSEQVSRQIARHPEHNVPEKDRVALRPSSSVDAESRSGPAPPWRQSGSSISGPRASTHNEGSHSSSAPWKPSSRRVDDEHVNHGSSSRQSPGEGERQHLLAPRHFAGKFIGVRGSNIKALTEEFGCKLSLSDSDDPCVITVSGSKDNVQALVTAILRRHPEVYEPSDLPVEVYEPSDLPVEEVIPIRRRGNMINIIFGRRMKKEIERRCHVQIETIPGYLANYTKVSIKGHKSDVAKARTQIFEASAGSDDRMEVHIAADTAAKLTGGPEGFASTMERETGARLEIGIPMAPDGVSPLPPEVTKWGEYVVVVITGPLQRVCLARKLVIDEARKVQTMQHAIEDSRTAKASQARQPLENPAHAPAEKDCHSSSQTRQRPAEAAQIPHEKDDHSSQARRLQADIEEINAQKTALQNEVQVKAIGDAPSRETTNARSRSRSAHNAGQKPEAKKKPQPSTAQGAATRGRGTGSRSRSREHPNGSTSPHDASQVVQPKAMPGKTKKGKAMIDTDEAGSSRTKYETQDAPMGDVEGGENVAARAASEVRAQNSTSTDSAEARVDVTNNFQRPAAEQWDENDDSLVKE